MTLYMPVCIYPYYTHTHTHTHTHTPHNVTFGNITGF